MTDYTQILFDLSLNLERPFSIDPRLYMICFFFNDRF